MTRPTPPTPTPTLDAPGLFLETTELQLLIELLRCEGYTVIGPTVDQDAIVYDEIESTDQLPRGIRDVQAAGSYRCEATGGSALFEFNVGPHSWKQFLFPSRVTVQRAERREGQWEFESGAGPTPRYAFLGVRSCELAAIAIQDRVLRDGPYVDEIYRARREAALLIAVNCTVAAATCFCTSMNTGPRCTEGFDLALTELELGFVLEIGSARGGEIAARLTTRLPTDQELQQAERLQNRAVEQISKRFDTSDVRELLLSNLNHPHWDEVAQRCLSCTNCTLVCPTCFCSTVTEVADLTGERVDRQREWDSCFNRDFSYTAGGTVRDDRRSRYRQWLTHKLATWHDQFDSSGCVGCGRCITWCPVGIDLTEEVAVIREQASGLRSLPVVHTESAAACAVRKTTP